MMKKIQPETQTDPACLTRQYAIDLDLETRDLLCRDRIGELADDEAYEKLQALLGVYANHKGDLADFGEVASRFIIGLAEAQAIENISGDYL